MAEGEDHVSSEQLRGSVRALAQHATPSGGKPHLYHPSPLPRPPSLPHITPLSPRPASPLLVITHARALGARSQLSGARVLATEQGARPSVPWSRALGFLSTHARTLHPTPTACSTGYSVNNL